MMKPKKIITLSVLSVNRLKIYTTLGGYKLGTGTFPPIPPNAIIYLALKSAKSCRNQNMRFFFLFLLFIIIKVPPFYPFSLTTLQLRIPYFLSYVYRTYNQVKFAAYRLFNTREERPPTTETSHQSISCISKSNSPILFQLRQILRSSCHNLA